MSRLCFLMLSSFSAQCRTAQTDYHVELIPFPIRMWYTYFRFMLILNWTFEGSSHPQVSSAMLINFLMFSIHTFAWTKPYTIKMQIWHGPSCTKLILYIWHVVCTHLCGGIHTLLGRFWIFLIGSVQLYSQNVIQSYFAGLCTTVWHFLFLVHTFWLALFSVQLATIYTCSWCTHYAWSNCNLIKTTLFFLQVSMHR